MADDSRIRVLVADDNPARGKMLVGVLADSGYDVVGLVGPGTRLPTLVAEAGPDLILIHTHAPTRDTLEQLKQIKNDMPRPIVMFAKDQAPSTICAVVEAGVSVYIADGLSNRKLKPIIDVAMARFQHQVTMSEELERTRNALEERKAIDRAKGIVMQKKNCSEAEAFAILRRLAMDQKKRIGEVANNLVQLAKPCGTG